MDGVLNYLIDLALHHLTMAMMGTTTMDISISEYTPIVRICTAFTLASSIQLWNLSPLVGSQTDEV